MTRDATRDARDDSARKRNIDRLRTPPHLLRRASNARPRGAICYVCVSLHVYYTCTVWYELQHDARRDPRTGRGSGRLRLVRVRRDVLLRRRFSASAPRSRTGAAPRPTVRSAREIIGLVVGAAVRARIVVGAPRAGAPQDARRSRRRRDSVPVSETRVRTAEVKIPRRAPE